MGPFATGSTGFPFFFLWLSSHALSHLAEQPIRVICQCHEHNSNSNVLLTLGLKCVLLKILHPKGHGAPSKNWNTLGAK